MINCGFLASDNPNAPETNIQKVADNIFLALYTIECVLKIIAKGFVIQPYSYLRDTWNLVRKSIILIAGLLGADNGLDEQGNPGEERVCRQSSANP